MKQHRAQGPVKAEHGQSLVEFALTFPLVLLILLGMIDLGAGFKTYMGLTNAAREGARWVSIHPTDRAGAMARVAGEAAHVGLSYGEISSGGYSVTFVPDKANYAAGEKVTVIVHYDYELLFGTLTGLPTVPFEGSTTMVVLYDE